MTCAVQRVQLLGAVEAQQRHAPLLVALDQDQLLVAHGIASKTSESSAAQPGQ